MTAEATAFLMENNVSRERLAGIIFTERSAKILLYSKCISVIYIVVCKYSVTAKCVLTAVFN